MHVITPSAGGPPLFIVDAHEDIAYNALHNDRDVRSSVVRTRQVEAAMLSTNCCGISGMSETAMVGLPDQKRGGVGLVFATIFTEPGEQEAVTADGWAQIRYYQELANDRYNVRLITQRHDLTTLQHDWAVAPSPLERPVGYLLLMEGADPIREPGDLAEWQRQGLRIVGPAWRGTRYSGGTRAPGPLTDLGRDLLREMERLGVMLDLSHMAEESFWQALDLFGGTVIASHSNCRAFTPTDRHLSDEMIRAIAARDGIIGTVLSNTFLVHGWQPDDEPVTLDAVVRHIDHICQLTGTTRHSGIGSDFDGGFGVETTPDEFDSVADLGQLATALERRGYSQSDIEGILGANWLRLLDSALPE